MNPDDKKYADSLRNLLSIMNELRTKCPWDKKQTLESLRHLTIEETYELSDAVLDGDLVAIKEELGDLMLHIVFYSKIAKEQEAFDLSDVMNGVCDKLISRHPHVFGDSNITDAETVKKSWELLKLQEKNNGVLAGVPKSLPALIKAQRIQEKLNGVGFDWKDKKQVWEKIEEELDEFKQALQENNGIEAEFGDLLFSLVNYARFIEINSETALEKTNKKVIKRFNYIEYATKRDGNSLSDLTLTEMNAYWEEAKNKL